MLFAADAILLWFADAPQSTHTALKPDCKRERLFGTSPHK